MYILFPFQNEIPDCALFTTITFGSDTDTASEGEQESTGRVDSLTTAEAVSNMEAQVMVQSDTPCTDSTVDASMPKPLTHLFDEKHSLLSQAELQKELDKIMQTLPAYFSELNCNHLQKSTLGQSSCKQWFEQRQGRITASHFNEVLKCKTSHVSVTSKIMGYTSSRNAPALAWGKNSEKLEAFTSNQMTCHDSLSVEEVGLVLNPKFPHLGASPDGIVHCKCCPPSTLEIKCPLKYANMSITDAIKSKDFCLGKNFELKKYHAYYAQVQGQIAVCELKTSYFVIWTTEDCHTQKVEFSEEYWAQIRPKLDLFYRQHILTEICTHKLKKQFLIAETSCLCKCRSETSVTQCSVCHKVFHLKCVGLKRHPGEQWFCSACSP